MSDEIVSDDDIIYECDVCDETIIAKNEDIKTALALHYRTPYHREICERIYENVLCRDIDELSLPSLDSPSECSFEMESFSAFDAGGHIESASSDSSSNAKGPSVPFGAFYENQKNCCHCLFFCAPCQTGVEDSPAMLRHLVSEKHTRLERLVKELSTRRELLALVGFTAGPESESGDVTSYFSKMDAKKKLRQCLACDCVVPSAEYNLLDHLRGQSHVMKVNSPFVSIGKNCSFYCILCDEQNSGQKKLNEHYTSVNHRQYVDSIYEVARYHVC